MVNELQKNRTSLCFFSFENVKGNAKCYLRTEAASSELSGEPLGLWPLGSGILTQTV